MTALWLPLISTVLRKQMPVKKDVEVKDDPVPVRPR